MVGWALRDLVRAVLRLAPGASTQRMLLHASVAGILAILVGGLLERNIGDSEVLTLFWALLACGYTAIRGETERDESNTQ